METAEIQTQTNARCHFCLKHETVESSGGQKCFPLLRDFSHNRQTKSKPHR